MLAKGSARNVVLITNSPAEETHESADSRFHPLAQWQSLGHEAQASRDRKLDEAMESYLVFLPMRFSRESHCTARVMTEDYLHAFSSRSCAHIGCLRDVGNHCLLFSGLFPQLAERRLVSIGYFINRGLSAYM